MLRFMRGGSIVEKANPVHPGRRHAVVTRLGGRLLDLAAALGLDAAIKDICPGQLLHDGLEDRVGRDRQIDRRPGHERDQEPE